MATYAPRSANSIFQRKTIALMGSTCLAAVATAAPAQAQSCEPMSAYDTTGTTVHTSPDSLIINVSSSDASPGSSFAALPAPSVTAVKCENDQSENPVRVTSTGGNGGSGSSDEIGGNGGAGGKIIAEVLSDATILTTSGPAMSAVSQGGNGGNAGDADTFGTGKNGGAGGNGGDITMVNGGFVGTKGNNSAAMYGLTRGGIAGKGGDGSWLLGGGGNGGNGGFSGADVVAINSGWLTTNGSQSSAISLNSVGGDGDYGGSSSSVLWAVGGNGGAGGNGGKIEATNSGTITTTGYNSKGIEATSVGGGGGGGGEAFAAGLFTSIAIGGSGGRGGQGGAVSVGNSGQITTWEFGSLGIRAQSIGGGGGDGGSGTAASAGVGFDFSFSVGGSGGNGGSGQAVTIDHSGAIQTGSTHLDAFELLPGASLPGDHATGILAQSIGGGGGNGHQAWAFAASASDESSASLAVALGGSGGDGGSGGSVTTTSSGSIGTNGRFASGLVAQSIGGGGGNGGNSMTVAASAGSMALDLSFNLAGAGGTGGTGGAVDTTVSGDITTIGLHSGGVIAQSISGGGGNGGNVMDTSVAAGNKAYTIGVAIGGEGGTGQGSGNVNSTLSSGGTVHTYGDLATGMLGQSIAGGGGNGGSVQTYAVSLQGGEGMAGAATVSLGGHGGVGGGGGSVTQTIDGVVTTYGALSRGVVAQSIGGGGGNGGHVFAVDVAASLDSSETDTEGRAVEASVSIGGNGGSGGNGGTATLDMSGSIVTNGAMGTGALIQSIGGGGGNGGNVHSFSMSTALPTSAEDLSNRIKTNLGLLTGAAKYQANTNFGVNVDVGGSGGTGGVGGAVEALLTDASISTTGEASSGLVIQSIGGGGGVGGNVVANGFIGISSINANVNVGGNGGDGGTGGSVTVRNTQDIGAGAVIGTTGDHSYGVHAQSIGGGGGIGGSVHSTEYLIKHLSKTAVTLSVGGTGGTGGTGGAVAVSDVSAVTSGINAYGIVSQSIGGGGGTGNVSSGSGGTALYLGGNGGDGNHGGTVKVVNAIAQTTGTGAIGIVAQSIGGGGGNAGLASMGKLVSEADQAIGGLLQFNIGGNGGNGGDVNVGCPSYSYTDQSDCAFQVSTTGDAAMGVVAQSIGGGGGLIQVSTGSFGPIDFKVSGTPGGSGSSGRVRIIDYGSGSDTGVTTSGDGAIGILAQSIDSGGAAFILDDAPASMTNDMSINFNSASNGGVLVDLSKSVTTSGDYAHGILAQSLTNAYTVFTAAGQTVYGSASIGINDNKASNQITLRSGEVSTSGDNAHGIYVQTSSSLAAANEDDPYMSENTGYGSDRAQTIDIGGSISVTGADSYGIYSTNKFGSTVAYDLYTTHVIVESTSTISAGANSGGAIFIEDDGNVAIDIYGAVTADSPFAVNASAGLQLDVNIAQYANVTGAIQTEIADSSGQIFVTVAGTLNGSIVTTSNGGDVRIEATNGEISATGNTAILIDTTDAWLDVGTVNGYIQGTEVDPTGPTAMLNAHGTITGTVDGAFHYGFVTAEAQHVLNVSGGTDGGDLVWIGALDLGQTNDRFKINLTELPTNDFAPLYLMYVGQFYESEATLESGTPQTLLGLNPDTLATQYDIAISYPEDGQIMAMLNGITIDFTRAGLTGNFADVAKLANAQVAAYATGDSTVTSDDNLVKYLLMGANETDLTRLEDEMTVLEPSLHYNNVTTDSAAVQAALNDLQSCGDATLASINPIAQGECNWAKFIWRDSQHLDGDQREKAKGLALGRQFEVGTNLHLGLSGVYEWTRFSSETATSRGGRVGAGGILKYSKEANFASLSMMGAYSWADGRRAVTLPEEIGADTMIATAEQKATTFTTRLRGGHLFDLGGIDLTALGDADFIVSHHGGYTEEGAGSLNLVVAPKTNVVFDVRPAAQLGTHVALGAVDLRAYGEFGYRYRFGDLDMSAGLANGLDTSFLANVVSQRDRSLPTLGAGLILDLSDKFEARLTYDIEKGEHDRIEKFSAKLGYKF